MNNEQRIMALEEEIVKLKSLVSDISGQFYKNNSSSTQVFNKDAVFNVRLRVPVYSVAPSIGEIGDLIAVVGELFICTTASTGGTGAVFTLVGSQT